MILYLNSNHSEVSWNKRDYLMAAAKRLGFDWVVPYNNEQHPEYVLNIEPYGHLVSGTKWTGVWEIDVMFDRPQMSLSDWIASDIVFVANTFIPERMERFQGKRVTMFQACDPEFQRTIPSIPKEYDFVLSGTIGLEVYRERERAIQVLKDVGFTYKDFGKGHPPMEYINYLNHAKVQFIRSAAKPFIGSSQIEQRFFECLAIGPVLKDYHPELENIGLVEGKDFYWYKDDKEMIDKMTHLVTDEEFARKMAENGREKALLYHTYDNRLTSIINFIKETERK